MRFPIHLLVCTVCLLCAACISPVPRFPSSTLPFMGPNDFAGSYKPRPYDAVIGGQASYQGTVIFANLDRSLLQPVLPPGFRLANNVRGMSVHPVMLLYGHQLNTSWLILGQPIPIGNDYNELTLLIPFVQSNSGSRWHNFAVRMYLNDVWAIWLGNQFFAYAKEEGSFTELASQIKAYVSSILYLEATIQTIGSWQSSAQAQTSLPNYAAMQTILEMPVLGRRELGDPTPVCSYFEWHYDQALVASAQSSHRFAQPLRAGMEAWPALGWVSSVPGGAFALKDIEWRIDHPPPQACAY